MTKIEYNREYRKTHKADWTYWSDHQYQRIKRDQKNKFKSGLPFSLEEFRNWVLSNYSSCIYKMLEEYKSSNYDKYLSPSIDRIDDYKDYNFDNMQLLTWSENNIKGRLGRKNKEQCGTMAKEHWSKTVLQYDLNMNLITIFPSTREASRILNYDNSGIARACRLHKPYKGYRWEYEQQD